MTSPQTQANDILGKQLPKARELSTGMEQKASHPSKKNGQHQSAGQLGPLLCWAVVFADIGSSIYYVPGILYGNVGNLAGFFVLLTMSVFVLLTLKYAEVSARFPEGGGVVTVAAQAMNSWVGALGGMFILVSYFLTASISCLSAIQYLSVVVPAIGPFLLEITISVLVLLGLLNWVGISESAKVSLVAALVAFVSDLAIIWTVFSRVCWRVSGLLWSGEHLATLPSDEGTAQEDYRLGALIGSHHDWGDQSPAHDAFDPLATRQGGRSRPFHATALVARWTLGQRPLADRGGDQC